MNEKFVTEAIKNDRYLKAVRLTRQFEKEIDRELQNFVEETINDRPDLFVDDAGTSENESRVNTEPLAHMRRQAKLDRVDSKGNHLKFYLSIKWTQPEVHGHETDGALCYVHYKIKNLPRIDYDQVKQQTQTESKWDEIQFSDDVNTGSQGIFYIPVTDGHEVKEGLQTLQQHFLSFGEEFVMEENSI